MDPVKSIKNQYLGINAHLHSLWQAEGSWVEESMFGLDVDYRELPPRFQRYHQGDQTRIAARMIAVLEAARAGVDLATGPFAVMPMILDEALAALEVLW